MRQTPRTLAILSLFLGYIPLVGVRAEDKRVSTVGLPARIEQRLRYEAFDCLVHMDLRVVNASTSGGIQNFVSGYPVRIGQLMVERGLSPERPVRVTPGGRSTLCA